MFNKIQMKNQNSIQNNLASKVKMLLFKSVNKINMVKKLLKEKKKVKKLKNQKNKLKFLIKINFQLILLKFNNLINLKSCLLLIKIKLKILLSNQKKKNNFSWIKENKKLKILKIRKHKLIIMMMIIITKKIYNKINLKGKKFNKNKLL